VQVADRALVRLDALLADQAQHDLVLGLGEPVDLVVGELDPA
jgi:hypothetical protein